MSWYTFFKIFTFGLYYEPFTHDPLKFKLYSKPDGTYMNLMYSANGGLTWKYVMVAAPPILRFEKWQLYKLRFHQNDLIEMHDSFPNYQSILDFEEKERDKVKRGNKKLTPEQIRRRLQIRENIEKSKNSEYRGISFKDLLN